MPITAYMKSRITSNIPIELIAGSALINVSKITAIAFTRLIILKTRPILRTLRIVPRIASLVPIPGIIRTNYTTHVPITTIKSKQFQASLKYFIFNAISLIIASNVKISEKP